MHEKYQSTVNSYHSAVRRYRLSFVRYWLAVIRLSADRGGAWSIMRRNRLKTVILCAGVVKIVVTVGIFFAKTETFFAKAAPFCASTAPLRP